ncbi:MAG: tetratricopeptide repeat protein, partial [Odoribacteraceae bacterium]|nr:tetratricopeptide repeat protein [Odoribacteraceae bacterium]
ILPIDPYNQIGLAGFTLKEDVKQAEAIFKEVLSGRLYKKDVNVHLAVANAYLQAGNTAKAMEYIERAKKSDNKSGYPFLLEGDILRSQHRLGEAATSYDHAIYFSPELVGAYMKSARIYMTSNSNRAVAQEKLQKIKEFAPDFTGVDCLLGELYELQGDSKKALEHYSRFIEAGNYDVEHLLRYAGILHFDKQYEKMLPIILPVLEKNPDNLVAKRLHAYALSKTEGGGKSIEAIKHFIETTPEDSHIALDYSCYAEQLIANDQYAEAIPYYGKVIQKDSTKRALWLTMGDTFVRIGSRDSADYYYALYESILPSPDLQLIFKRGRNLFFAGSSDSDQQERHATLQKADTMFVRLLELAPTFVPAYFWRSRIHALLDPETIDGLAKPFFDEAIAKATESGDTERYKKDLSEAYRYLGYYYYQQADSMPKKENNISDAAREKYLEAKKHFAKALEYNPDDAISAEALQGLATIQ